MNNYVGRCGRCNELIEDNTLEDWHTKQLDHQNFHQIEDGNGLFDNYEHDLFDNYECPDIRHRARVGVWNYCPDCGKKL